MEEVKINERERSGKDKIWIGEICIGDENVFIDLPEACNVCGKCRENSTNTKGDSIVYKKCYIPCG